MRKSMLYIRATAHLPVAGRDGVDRLIETARREPVGGRLLVEQLTLAIEPHQFGVLVATAVIGDHSARPNDVSEAHWRLLAIAFAAGAFWIPFDRDEPPHPGLAVF